MLRWSNLASSHANISEAAEAANLTHLCFENSAECRAENPQPIFATVNTRL